MQRKYSKVYRFLMKCLLIAGKECLYEWKSFDKRCLMKKYFINH